MRRTSMRFLLLFSLLWATACDNEPELESPDYPCDKYLSADAIVEGRWVITGYGLREECQDDRLNTDHFELGSAPLYITQSSDLSSIHIPNPPVIQGGQFKMTKGKVDGTCVSFEITEAGPQGKQAYSFSGAADGSNVVGAFNLLGPEECEGYGQFSITIQPPQ